MMLNEKNDNYNTIINKTIKEILEEMEAMDELVKEEGRALESICRYLLNGESQDVITYYGLRQLIVELKNNNPDLLARCISQIGNRFDLTRKYVQSIDSPFANIDVLDRIVNAYYRDSFSFLDGKLSTYDKLVSAITSQNPRSVPTPGVFEEFTKKIVESEEYYNYHQGKEFNHIHYRGNGGNEIYKLYLNGDSDSSLKFILLFSEECKKRNVPFHLKTGLYYAEGKGTTECNPFTLMRDESIVIYSSTYYFLEYVDICKKIIGEYPNLTFYQAPLLCGMITNQIGFGIDEINQRQSYNSKMSNMVEGYIIKLEKEFVQKYGKIVLNQHLKFDINKLKEYNLYEEFLDSLYVMFNGHSYEEKKGISKK